MEFKSNWKKSNPKIQWTDHWPIESGSNFMKIFRYTHPYAHTSTKNVGQASHQRKTHKTNRKIDEQKPARWSFTCAKHFIYVFFFSGQRHTNTHTHTYTEQLDTLYRTRISGLNGQDHGRITSRQTTYMYIHKSICIINSIQWRNTFKMLTCSLIDHYKSSSILQISLSGYRNRFFHYFKHYAHDGSLQMRTSLGK